MPSQWERLCEILERAETMPAKHKSEYLAAAIKALAYECHAAGKSVQALKAMTSKMEETGNGEKPRKKRRAAI